MIASIITALFLMGTITSTNAYTFLYIYGVLLLVAEAFVASFGTLALSGILALYVGYAIQTGDNMVFGILIDWPLIFGFAFVELAGLAVAGYIFLKHRGDKNTTGAEAMIGQKATVVEWSGKRGRVIIHGETWKAFSDNNKELEKDSEVTVKAVDGLKVKI